MVKSYRSYLLRLWRTGTGPKATWRASLETVDSESRIGFADLDALFAYLRAQTAGPLEPEVSDEPTPEPTADGVPPETTGG